MFQTFIYKDLYPELVDGLFLCDPKRLHMFLGDDIRRSDLLSRLQITEEIVEICRKGIAIPVFGVEPQNYTIVARHENESPYLGNPPRVTSTGWSLTTDSGNLVICALSNLMYWDPDDTDRILDGHHNAYVHFQIAPGSYKVDIRGGINDEESDEAEWIFEFVFFPAIKDDLDYESHVDLTRTHLFHSDDDAHSSYADPSPKIHILPKEDQSDENFTAQLLSRLNKTAFSSFVVDMFDEDEEPFIEVAELGKGIFRKPWLDSYGESLETVFVLQYLPLDVLSKPGSIDIADDPFLAVQLTKVREHYRNKAGAFGMVSGHLVPATKLRALGFLTNLFGIEKRKYFDELIPDYKKLLQNLSLYIPQIFVGSYDSFIDLSAEETSRTLKDFLIKYSDGITISLSDVDAKVSPFLSERNLNGVLDKSKYICEPILIREIYEKKKAIVEFEALLRAETKENELEDFLKAHYKEIFGYNYDRIETQLWLKFPELDIAQKNRRLDIFLRNSVESDWGLFEVKRIIPLTGMYRDVPTIAAAISYAVQQVKSYARLLAQDSVKRALARQGIEYYEPSLNLVVGRTPNLSQAQWRWLVASHDRDVRILTYDDLLKQMRNNLDVYDGFLKSVSKMDQ